METRSARKVRWAIFAFSSPVWIRMPDAKKGAVHVYFAADESGKRLETIPLLPPAVFGGKIGGAMPKNEIFAAPGDSPTHRGQGTPPPPTLHLWAFRDCAYQQTACPAVGRSSFVCWALNKSYSHLFNSPPLPPSFYLIGLIGGSPPPNINN